MLTTCYQKTIITHRPLQATGLSVGCASVANTETALAAAAAGDGPVDWGFHRVVIGSHTCVFGAAAHPAGAFEQQVEGGLLIVLLPV